MKADLPFSSIVGMDSAKKALVCSAVDDDIKGVIIRGPSGTAKSVLVRAFSHLVPDKVMVEVPQNISDEQLFGGLDLETAVKEGRSVVLGGLLQRADRNILYIDNVNLFEDKVIANLMECVMSGEVILEREGISARYPLRTTVIATMDPAEKEMPGTVLDRFDMCVSVIPDKNVNVRSDITDMELAFDEDRTGFIALHGTDDSIVMKSIKEARKLLPGVKLTKEDYVQIAQICDDLYVIGHRGDIAVARVSRALAAMDGRKAVVEADIREASVMCLIHRATMKGEDAEDIPSDELDDDQEDDVDVMELVETDVDVDDIDEETIVVKDFENISDKVVAEPQSISQEIMGEIDNIIEFEAIRLHEMVGIKNKREDVSIKRNSGRYHGSRIPAGKTTDPAFDATVRAAAPYQKSRPSKGLSLVIEPGDIREKIRLKRDSCSFLFMVDVSGSLVVGSMMQMVQGAIRSMLMDNYVKRDKVALMTFRADKVDLAVPFTRSVESICDTLENTPTGDATPLNQALLAARDYLVNYQRKHPDERCYVVLITDAQGNVPAVPGKEPLSELKKIVQIMDLPNTEWAIIDSSDGLTPKKEAVRLARWLNAKYFKLGDLGMK